MRILILAMFAALVGASTAKADPPIPGQADCVWRSIPKADRDNIIASSTSTDDVVAKLQTLAPTALPKIVAACHTGTDQASQGQVGFDMSTKLLEIWAITQIQAQYKVTPAALSAAWLHIPAAMRGQIAAGAEANAQATPDQAQAVRDMATSLGLAGNDALNLVGMYVASRAMFEQAGGTG